MQGHPHLCRRKSARKIDASERIESAPAALCARRVGGMSMGAEGLKPTRRSRGLAASFLIYSCGFWELLIINEFCLRGKDV